MKGSWDLLSASWGLYLSGQSPDGRVVVNVRAREDDLQVEFRPTLDNGRVTGFTSVYLTGPAKMYGKALRNGY